MERKHNDRPYTSNYPALQTWLNRIGARCCEQLPVGSNPDDPAAYVETWIANGRVFIVHIHSRQQGWEIYTAHEGNSISATLEDAEKRLGLF